MKKGLILFAVLLLVAVAYAAVTHNVVRVAGSATLSGDQALMIHDSTDTFLVDTFYSDTIDVLEAGKANIGIYYIDYTEADSANDSIVIIVRAFTAYGTGGEYQAQRVIYTDTIHDTNATTALAGTITDFHHFDSDTLLGTSLWFQTIVEDSFIMGDGIDTSILQMRFHVAQRKCDD